MPIKTVLAIIYTPSFGGPHNQIKQLNEGMLKHGYKYSLCVPKSDHGYQEEMRLSGIEVYNYEPARLRYANAIFNLLRYTVRFPIDVFNYYQIIQKSKCDVVQICGLLCLQAGIAARLSGKPIVWQLLSTIAPPALRAVLMPFVGLLSNRIMTTGIHTAIQHPYYNLWKHKNISFYPPVKDSLFSPSHEFRLKTRAILGFGENDFIVGTVGNKNRLKNHISLIDMIIGLKSTRTKPISPKFLIAGHDDPGFKNEYEATVTKKARDYGLFNDNALVSTDSKLGVPQLLNTMDIFILTSLTEGTPTVIIESLACGKPVIAPNFATINEMLANNPYCFLYDELIPSQIEEHIGKILNASSEAVKSSCLKHYQDKFSYLQCVELHISAFNTAQRKNR